MANPKHTLRKPFTIPDEPIEGLAIAIHREEDEEDYDTVPDEDETAAFDNEEIADACPPQREDSANDPEDLTDVL